MIFVKSGSDARASSRVMSVVGSPDVEAKDQAPKRAKVMATPTLDFSEEDKEGTFQPHDDALVVTLRIDGYDVNKVLVDQGCEAEIMYPNLYKGLNLKPKDFEGMIHP